MVLESTSTSNFGGLESRFAVMRSVMEAVCDDKIRIIGICGMGGIGKTTMVFEICKSTRQELLFDEIAIVFVSRKLDVTIIQNTIAHVLGLELKEHSSLARASLLHQRLSQKGANGKPKRILIILDDLWEALDLEEVGIPFPNDHNGCKIIMTSRSKDACARMEANKLFFISPLSEDEAWVLFQNSLPTTTTLYPVAKEIVKKCGGLPIAIKIIARWLADEEEDGWIYTLRQFGRSLLTGNYPPLFDIFNLSYYENLAHEEIKRFFQLCSLFPEDSNIPIERLVRYGMGLRCFQHVDSLQVARSVAHEYVHELENKNLLLGSDDTQCVKMHNLVREFVLFVVCHLFVVRSVEQLSTCLEEDTIEDRIAISLQCDKIGEVPNGLNYPKLKLLHLVSRSGHSLEVPERLYEGMRELQILDLSGASILGSLHMLTNLRTLCLDNCTLMEDLSFLENLQNLEILSCAYSNIQELPSAMRFLSRLRLLDLTWCRKLCRVSPGLLSSLNCLEELYMRGTSILWAEQIGRNHDGETNACFAELKSLSRLVVIEVDVPYEVLPIAGRNRGFFRKGRKEYQRM